MNKSDLDPCSHITRDYPDAAIDADTLHKIATDYRTLPSFASTLYNRKLIKHYSLERNELLRCRWKAYLDSIYNKDFEPFQFPEQKDWHFYNGTIRRMPSLTVSRWKDLRMKMRSGPGVDSLGQMFIPVEMLMVRGEAIKEDVAEKKRKMEGEKRKREAKSRALDIIEKTKLDRLKKKKRAPQY